MAGTAPAASPSVADRLVCLGDSITDGYTYGQILIQAVAEIDSPAEKQVYLQIGIGVSTARLNGVKVHDQGDAWTGFHAGKERIAVNLRPGLNRLVVETGGPHFFMGVSDEMVWEGQLR